MTQAAWLRLSSVGEWKAGSSTSTSPQMKQAFCSCVKSKCTEVGTQSIVIFHQRGMGVLEPLLAKHFWSMVKCWSCAAPLVEHGITTARVRGLCLTTYWHQQHCKSLWVKASTKAQSAYIVFNLWNAFHWWNIRVQLVVRGICSWNAVKFLHWMV